MLLFYYFVFLFSHLSKNKMRQKVFLDAKKVAKQGPKLGHKNRPVIIHDGVEKSMVFYYHNNNHFCQSWSINSDFN